MAAKESKAYTVQEPLLHDGAEYAPGDVIAALTDKQAADLLAAGIIIAK